MYLCQHGVTLKFVSPFPNRNSRFIGGAQFKESQKDGRCHATTFAAISFYVLFYFYFVGLLYCHCCKNTLSIYLSISLLLI